MGANKIVTAFLFNHKFERNVPRLEAMYASRFSNRRYIMPFASSDDDHVIRVYESSFSFSGHLAQAGARLRDPDATHYVIISDDLVVNPSINEDNIVERLGLADGAGYMKGIASLDAARYRWWRSLEASIDLRRFSPYFDYLAELPDRAEAQRKFEAMGVDFTPPRVRSRRDLGFALGKLRRTMGWSKAAYIPFFDGKPAPYPLLCGYADFFVVPAAAFDRFIHYCGVFSAAKLFAEVAVPSALALAADSVVTELEPGELFNEPHHRRRPAALRGMEFWEPGEADTFAEGLGRNIDRLQTEFPADWLYIHPVKLSRWH